MGRARIPLEPKYGRLTPIKELPKTDGYRRISCLCDCGKIVDRRFDDLRSKRTKSCGCLKVDTAGQSLTKHGKRHSRIYSVWSNMKSRCFNPNSSSFRYYGKRGIGICNEWLDFAVFYEWAVLNGYSDTLTIERIDNNKDYEPSNCTWIVNEDQSRNTRVVHRMTMHGHTLCISQWSRLVGVSRDTIQKRLNKGWSECEALTTPTSKNKTKPFTGKGTV